jgi:hypothetical protein
LKTKFLYIIVFLCCCFNQIVAQNFRLQIQGNNKDSFINLSQIPLSFQTFTDCEIALQNAQKELIKKGYFSASIDSTKWIDSIAIATVFIGKKYEWASLKNKNIPQNLLTQFSI